jgi:hypothetical protein
MYHPSPWIIHTSSATAVSEKANAYFKVGKIKPLFLEILRPMLTSPAGTSEGRCIDKLPSSPDRPKFHSLWDILHPF